MTQIEGHPVGESVVTAFRISALERGDAPVTTLRLMQALSRADVGGEWQRIFLVTGPLDPHLAAARRESERASSRLEGVPVSDGVARAFRRADELREIGGLPEIGAALLAVALVEDPCSSAARALVEGSGRSHADVVQLVEETLLGFSAQVWRTAPPRPATAVHPDEGRQDVLVRVLISARMWAREHAAARTPKGEPDSVALLLACVTDPTADGVPVLRRMLLTTEELLEVVDSTANLPSEAADRVVERAGALAERRDVTVVELLWSVFIDPSSRIARISYLLGIAPNEAAAQLGDQRLRQDGTTRASPTVRRWSIAGAATRLATAIAGVTALWAGGGWWKLLLLVLVGRGHPTTGPVGQAVAALVSAVFFPWWVATLALAHFVASVGQALREREELWSDTGARVNLRQLRHIVRRHLTRHSAQGEELRQRAMATWRQARVS